MANNNCNLNIERWQTKLYIKKANDILYEKQLAVAAKVSCIRGNQNLTIKSINYGNNQLT